MWPRACTWDLGLLATVEGSCYYVPVHRWARGPNPTRMAAVSSTRALTPAAQSVATQDASHRRCRQPGAALPPHTPARGESRAAAGHTG